MASKIDVMFILGDFFDTTVTEYLLKMIVPWLSLTLPLSESLS